MWRPRIHSTRQRSRHWPDLGCIQHRLPVTCTTGSHYSSFEFSSSQNETTMKIQSYHAYGAISNFHLQLQKIKRSKWTREALDHHEVKYTRITVASYFLWHIRAPWWRQRKRERCCMYNVNHTRALVGQTISRGR